MSGQETGPLAVQHVQMLLSHRPMKASSEGNDVPAARGSRTATSTATPSDQAAHGTGPAPTARVTPPHVEADADRRRQPKHLQPSPPVRPLGHGRSDPERQRPQWTPHPASPQRRPRRRAPRLLALLRGHRIRPRRSRQHRPRPSGGELPPPLAAVAARGGEEKGCPAATLLAGRAGFRRPALAAARQGGEGEGDCGGGWLGRPPESPDAGACRTCIPRRSGLYNGIRFFFRGVLFSRGTTEFDLGRLSRHASEGFLRFIFLR